MSASVLAYQMGASMIETLDEADKSEFVETISVAFGDHPMMPPGLSADKSRRWVNTMLQTFTKAPDATLFGVRRHGILDCAAFVYDAAFEPRGWQLLVFLFQMLRVFGWGLTLTFARVFSKKPVRKGRPLELLLLGTRTSAQGQGLGRAMLRHIFEFADLQGYDSVILEVAKDTPAFGFYLREGFLVDKEVALPTTPLCFLRRPIAEEKNDDGNTATNQLN